MTQHALALVLAGLLAVIAALTLTALRGRISPADYQRYLRSARWQQTVATFDQHPRARRCAACHAWQTLETHHWTYRNLGAEWHWQLVKLCGRDHQRVHDLSALLFSRRTAGLWLTTPALVAAGRLRRRVLGYGPGGIRHDQPTSRGRLNSSTGRDPNAAAPTDPRRSR